MAPKHVNQGHAEAANNLGGMYEYGYGVPVGMILRCQVICARFHFLFADCEQAFIKYRHACLHYFLKLTIVTFVTISESANKGDALGAYNLARCFENGTGDCSLFLLCVTRD